jgi:hypothetical protein
VYILLLGVNLLFVSDALDQKNVLKDIQHEMSSLRDDVVTLNKKMNNLLQMIGGPGVSTKDTQSQASLNRPPLNETKDDVSLNWPPLNETKDDVFLNWPPITLINVTTDLVDECSVRTVYYQTFRPCDDISNSSTIIGFKSKYTNHTCSRNDSVTNIGSISVTDCDENELYLFLLIASKNESYKIYFEMGGSTAFESGPILYDKIFIDNHQPITYRKGQPMRLNALYKHFAGDPYDLEMGFGLDNDAYLYVNAYRMHLHCYSHYGQENDGCKFRNFQKRSSFLQFDIEIDTSFLGSNDTITVWTFRTETKPYIIQAVQKIAVHEDTEFEI